MVFKNPYEHLWNLHNFNVAPNVLQILQGSGFENILCLSRIKSKLNTSTGLVNDMAQQYNTEFNCFDFPGGFKLYISLVDVFNIWGMPIVGRPIVGDEYHGREINERLFPNHHVFTKTKGFKSSELKNIATNIKNTLEDKVRATVLYILGSVVVPNGSPAYVKAHYGVFLEDIHRIKTYAWGELMLVAIHQALHKYKETPKGGIGGSMFTLIVSFFNFVGFNYHVLCLFYLFTNIYFCFF